VPAAQPGHLLGPLTGPGRLGPAQPMWAALSQAQTIKNKKQKSKKSRKIK